MPPWASRLNKKYRPSWKPDTARELYVSSRKLVAAVTALVINQSPAVVPGRIKRWSPRRRERTQAARVRPPRDVGSQKEGTPNFLCSMLRDRAGTRRAQGR